jgi:carbohydrate diacid regulator
MKSNQKLQRALDEIKEITGHDSILYSTKGSLVVCTGEPERDVEPFVQEFLTVNAEQSEGAGYLWYKILVEGETEYIFGLCFREESDRMIARMACCQIRNLAESFAEQFDRNNFIQNVLLGNMLTVDIFSKAKKLHIEPASRVVFVIDTGKKNNDLAVELVKNLSDMRSRDFVTSIDEHSIVLVKDVSACKQDSMDEELKRIASRLVDNLHMEAMIKVRVGYGNVVRQITEIPQSYQEARMALEVGRVFYAEHDTISYGKLGIGRLIYQLPMSLCNMYIKEVFGDEIPEILDDEESMSTINKFFENNLNISETARQLYVHRNTLVYRLERIQKAIGLDIRMFDDAMTFRIAVMVIAHVRAQNEKGV